MALTRSSEVDMMKEVKEYREKMVDVVQQLVDARQSTKAEQLRLAIYRCDQFLLQFEAYE